jgi:hypothetical protein
MDNDEDLAGLLGELSDAEEEDTLGDGGLADILDDTSHAAAPDDVNALIADLDDSSDGETPLQPGESPPSCHEQLVLPKGWERIVDPASGRAYYCNRSTQQSRWDPPPMVSSMPEAIPPSHVSSLPLNTEVSEMSQKNCC